MKKRIILGILLLVMFLFSGCAVTDYLTGKDIDSVGLSEDSSDSEDVDSEIDAILKELEEESEDNEETVTELNEVVEDTEEDVEEEVTEIAEEEEVEEDVEEEVPEDAIEITVKEGEKVRLKPVADDPDKDTIYYTFSEPVNEEGEWQTNYGDAGTYMISVVASDGKLKTTKNVKLVVERVNVAPVIQDIQDVIVNEGDTLTLSPQVSDPNGDKVSVSISEPVGDDGVWEIGYQSAGSYDVEITASDGEKTTVEKVDVTVKHKNIAPEIKGVSNIKVKEGETVKIEPSVTDVNGDEVTVTISEPIGNDGVWETGFTDNGEYEVTVKATDGKATTTKTIFVLVEDVNKAPVIVDISND